MKKLIIMVGLPRSGKSIYAFSTGNPVVSLDAIQYAYCGKHLTTLYDFVNMRETFAKYMIKSLFLAGHSKVIIDGCNHTKEERQKWIDLCIYNDYEYEFKFINTDSKTCIERAKGFKNSEWLTSEILKIEQEFEYDDL